MRIGVFGGTFDPIHNGHLVIAQTAINELSLEKVLFVPASMPPHKLDHSITSSEIRMQLVKIAISDNPSFAFSSLEFRRKGPSYMVDTLEELKSNSEYKNAQLYLIIGADNLLTFHTWYKFDRIFELCHIAVYPRFDANLNRADSDFMAHVVVFNAPRMEISSSYIRYLIRQKKSIQYLVPDKVRKYILQQSLYP